jgi:hypothetical protein
VKYGLPLAGPMPANILKRWPPFSSASHPSPRPPAKPATPSPSWNFHQRSERRPQQHNLSGFRDRDRPRYPERQAMAFRDRSITKSEGASGWQVRAGSSRGSSEHGRPPRGARPSRHHQLLRASLGRTRFSDRILTGHWMVLMTWVSDTAGIALDGAPVPGRFLSSRAWCATACTGTPCRSRI